jgi:hypothetical protein
MCVVFVILSVRDRGGSILIDAQNYSVRGYHLLAVGGNINNFWLGGCAVEEFCLACVCEVFLSFFVSVR